MIPSNKIGLIVIVKNERPYIVDWLAFHRVVGVGRFWFYDDDSEDGTGELLMQLERHKLIDGFSRVSEKSLAKGQGRFYGLPMGTVPLNTITPCERRGYRSLADCAWVGGIDADEFLTPMRDNSIGEFLARVPASARAMTVNWMRYTAGGRAFYDPLPVWRRFSERQVASSPISCIVKTLARPSAKLTWWGPHSIGPRNVPGYVDDTFAPVEWAPKDEQGMEGIRSVRNSWHNLALVHYQSRSFYEFKQRKLDRTRGPSAAMKVQNGDITANYFYNSNTGAVETDTRIRDRFGAAAEAEVKRIYATLGMG